MFEEAVQESAVLLLDEAEVEPGCPVEHRGIGVATGVDREPGREVHGAGQPLEHEVDRLPGEGAAARGEEEEVLWPHRFPRRPLPRDVLAEVVAQGLADVHPTLLAALAAADDDRGVPGLEEEIPDPQGNDLRHAQPGIEGHVEDRPVPHRSLVPVAAGCVCFPPGMGLQPPDLVRGEEVLLRELKRHRHPSSDFTFGTSHFT